MLEELIQALKRTNKKDYKYLAKKIKANAEINRDYIPKQLRRECNKVLISELDKYENDELINQLLLYLGKKIETEEEKANRK